MPAAWPPPITVTSPLLQWVWRMAKSGSATSGTPTTAAGSTVGDPGTPLVGSA